MFQELFFFTLLQGNTVTGSTETLHETITNTKSSPLTTIIIKTSMYAKLHCKYYHRKCSEVL